MKFVLSRAAELDLTGRRVRTSVPGYAEAVASSAAIQQFDTKT